MTLIEIQGMSGITLVADEAGDPSDPAVLMFHGGGQTRHAWGAAISTLAQQHWFATSIDTRGHGDSEWSPDGVYTLDTFAGDVARIASRYQRPVLVGASLGGISSLVAIGEGHVAHAAGLVLVDITPRIEEAGANRIRDFMRLGVNGFDSLEDVAEAIASYLPHRDRPASLDGVRKNVRQRDDGKWVWHWDPNFLTRVTDGLGEPTAGSFSPPERLQAACKNITVPTLLVRGGSSDVVNAEGAAELLELIPHAEMVDVPGAGHMVAGDMNDRFNAAVIEFLERVVRPSLSARPGDRKTLPSGAISRVDRR